MKTPDIENIKSEFYVRWLMKVQELYYLRKSKMTQSEMVRLTKRSLKTIQRFEKGDCLDPELMFIYQKLLKLKI